ncbi:hypothetical protein J7K25_03730 [bacterium]|nr:hypothetical protein [bacterium]
MNREIAVLYSGGTDSTCAVVLIHNEYDRIHLLTYQRFGLFSIKNTRTNVIRLKEKFGPDKFVHKIINIDRLFKAVSYDNYWYYFKRYRFFLLTTCGLCKLAMHIRTVLYCLNNGVKYVCDGANKYSGGGYFPAQMPEVIEEIKKFYARYGITYIVPVFELKQPQDIDWISKLGLKGVIDSPSLKKEEAELTTGRILYRMGFFPLENVKGTKIDRAMQARCFQLILFNIFLYWYYLPKYGHKKYSENVLNFYTEKVKYFDTLIQEYIEKGKNSKLYQLVY